MIVQYQRVVSIKSSCSPVPNFGHCPSIILLEGVLQVSTSHFNAASVIYLTEVSKVILSKGLGL